MVTIVYKTDNWHSFGSRDILGIITESNNAKHPTPLDIIKEQVLREGETLTEDDIYNIENLHQTQGYSGDGEFQIEEVETNCLI